MERTHAAVALDNDLIHHVDEAVQLVAAGAIIRFPPPYLP